MLNTILLYLDFVYFIIVHQTFSKNIFVKYRFNKYIKQYNKLKKWKIVWDNAKCRGGATDYSTKNIYFSSLFLTRCSIYNIEKLLIHEIAHVLAGEISKPHGFKWRYYNIKLGGTDSIYCYNYCHPSDNAALPESNRGRQVSICAERSESWRYNCFRSLSSWIRHSGRIGDGIVLRRILERILKGSHSYLFCVQRVE